MKTPFKTTLWARKVPAIFAVCALLAGQNLAWAQEPAIVGEATMVIGLAKLMGADGASRAVDRGTPIRVGDRIETQAGGHVHLRFVDGGRLSIRPASSLQVEDYSHSERAPQSGSIKFRLDEGVVRSITGSWGEAARDRFRLNTPVAAIGVKGTDFVVKSDGEKTSASVFTGAITLTPLLNGCSKTVGPCLNGSEKLLSEDMKGQMLEFSRQQSAPQLVPAVDLLARNARPNLGNEVAIRMEKSLPAEDSQALARASKTVESDVRASAVVAAIVPVLPVTPPAPPAELPVVVVVPPVAIPVVVVPPPVIKPPVVETPIVVVPPVPVVPVVPDLPVVSLPPVNVVVVVPIPLPTPILPPQVAQLVWSRFAWTTQMSGDAFTRNIEQAASTGFDRLPGNVSYSLYRKSAADGALLVATDAKASFRLADSTAQIVRNEGRNIDPVNVHSGTLDIDFTRASFTTALALTNATIGAESFTASGTIKTNGAFQTTASNGSLNGAVTLDGKEAGYAFVRSLNAGLVQGVTLWGR
ncbi:MAG: FecR domain-containing protein [Candidatus Saccharibacteria bacterium]|nr:FecR domain-containing protein [Rhodoferax sp.]